MTDEEMTEEEYFRKHYPDFCYGDKPLSPHWDFFEDGVEFGERQSEKKIEEIEQQIEKMKCCANCSEYDRHNRVCSRSKFVINETLCNCSDGYQIRR